MAELLCGCKCFLTTPWNVTGIVTGIGFVTGMFGFLISVLQATTGKLQIAF